MLVEQVDLEVLNMYCDEIEVVCESEMLTDLIPSASAPIN